MDFPGKKTEVVAIRLPFPSPIACPHFPPSFTENPERAAGSRCWRQENWGRRLRSTGAPVPGTLRRRDMAPPAQPQGCPLPRLSTSTGPSRNSSARTTTLPLPRRTWRRLATTQQPCHGCGWRKSLIFIPIQIKAKSKTVKTITQFCSFLTSGR